MGFRRQQQVELVLVPGGVVTDDPPATHGLERGAGAQLVLAAVRVEGPPELAVRVYPAPEDHERSGADQVPDRARRQAGVERLGPGQQAAVRGHRHAGLVHVMRMPGVGGQESGFSGAVDNFGRRL